MLLRRPRDLASLVRDGRARLGWSQSRLAEAAGVSRQWVSMVETGKTSVEFDLVVATLQALGYRLHVETTDAPTRDNVDAPSGFPDGIVHVASHRTPLTRQGERIGRQKTRRTKRGRNE